MTEMPAAMSTETELLEEWARDYLARTTEQRMLWLGARYDDLRRALDGVEQAMRYVLDQEGPIEELDHVIRSLQERLSRLRRQIEAVRIVRMRDRRDDRGRGTDPLGSGTSDPRE